MSKQIIISDDAHVKLRQIAAELRKKRRGKVVTFADVIDYLLILLNNHAS